MTKVDPLYLKQQLKEYDDSTKQSTEELNKASELFRDEKKATFLDLAKYSGATLGVMFTFLGVLVGLDGALSWWAKACFIIASILFVLCIMMSLMIRVSSNLFIFYTRKIFYLNDRGKSFSVQQTIIDQYPEQVLVPGKDGEDATAVMRERKESLQNASLKIDKELRKSKRFSKLYEKIFKYGSYVDYVVFASGYVVLTLFVFTVLKTI